MLSENEQKKIENQSGRLATIFELMHNLHRSNYNEARLVDFAEELMDMFSEQDCNLNVDLFKNIYNRKH